MESDVTCLVRMKTCSHTVPLLIRPRTTALKYIHTNTHFILTWHTVLRLSPEEHAQVKSQLDELKSTFSQLCDRSTAQLQQLEEQLAKEEKQKVDLKV